MMGAAPDEAGKAFNNLGSTSTGPTSSRSGEGAGATSEASDEASKA